MLRGITKIRASYRTQVQEKIKSNDLAKAIANFNIRRLKLQLYENSSSDSPLMKVLRLKQESKDNLRTYEEIKTFDLHDLALSLNFIGATQRIIKSQMITQPIYTQLLQTYFSKQQLYKQEGTQLVNNFIYLENSSFRDFIKRNQLRILQKQSIHNPIDNHFFEKIVTSDLFNITDLPSIYEFLYELYFPSLLNLSSLKDIHHSLIFLSKFSKLPIFFPQKIYEILEQEISSKKDITFTTFLEICNVLYLLMFHFQKIIEETKFKSSYEQLFKKVIQKNIIFDPGYESYAPQVYHSDISDPQIFFLNFKCLTLNEIIKAFQKRKQFLQKQKQTLTLALNRKLQEPKEDQLCLNSILSEQLKRIQKTMQRKGDLLLQKTFTEYKIKQSRVFFVAAMMPFLKEEIFYNYTSEQKNSRFFKNNICIPHLQKSFATIAKHLKKDEDKGQAFTKICKSLKNRLDKFMIADNLNLCAEDLISKQNIVSKTSILTYKKYFEELLWTQQGINKFVEFESKYDINKTNALSLVKNEPESMLNLMRWNSKSFLSKFHEQKEFKQLGLRFEPCKYTEGSGFKVTEEGKRKFTYFKFKNELQQSNHNEAEQSTQYLQGNLKKMIKSLRRLIKTL